MRGRGYHDFPSKIFSLTVRKKLVWEPFGASENLGYRKILCIWGVLRFSVGNFFLSHFTEKLPRGPSLFDKISVIEKFFARGGYNNFQSGGERVPGFSVDYFMSHGTEKFRRETLLCSRKIRVSKNFMHKNGISLVSVEFLASQCRKTLRRNPSVFQKCSGVKFFGIIGVSGFCLFFCCLTVPKNFVVEPFCASEMFR